MHSAQESPLLTAQELAERLRVEPNTVRRWARAGLIPVVRLPRVGLRFEYLKVCDSLKANSPSGNGGGR